MYEQLRNEKDLYLHIFYNIDKTSRRISLKVLTIHREAFNLLLQ
jgi:hypothetical protein